MCHSTWMKHPFYWCHSKKNLCTKSLFFWFMLGGGCCSSTVKSNIFQSSNPSKSQSEVLITFYKLPLPLQIRYKKDKETYSFFGKWSNRLLLVTHISKKPSEKPTIPKPCRDQHGRRWTRRVSMRHWWALYSALLPCFLKMVLNGNCGSVFVGRIWAEHVRTVIEFVFVRFCLLLGLGDVDTKEVLGGWKETNKSHNF